MRLRGDQFEFRTDGPTERCRIIAAHRKSAALLRTVQREGADHGVAACPDTAMQPVEIGCAIVFLDEEMKRRAVVPDVEGLSRLPDRYIACDPTHRIACRADPLPCVRQRGVGQIEHGNIVKAVRQQRVDQA